MSTNCRVAGGSAHYASAKFLHTGPGDTSYNLHCNSVRSDTSGASEQSFVGCLPVELYVQALAPPAALAQWIFLEVPSAKE